MVRLDAFIFGYRRVKVAREDIDKLANILLKLGINADISYDGEVILRERDVGAFLPLAKRKLHFTIGELSGIPGYLCRYSRRYGIIAALLIVLVLNVILSELVWDIRIDGNERISDTEVTELLRESGFEIGDVWRAEDKNRIEAHLLSKCPDIAWLSINRRGTVAYVQISESENVGRDDGEEEFTYCNVIADRDAVIEEITVKRGIAAVKAGDVVKKGDLLISGVIENERGVTLCHAEGSVRGVSLERLTAQTPREDVIRVYDERKLCEIRLNIFKFSINIFKNYRNHKSDCDIIENEKEYTLFGKASLPFSVTRFYARHYSDVPVTRTDTEMAQLAADRLGEITESFLRNADVIKLKTYGRFDADTYVMTSEVVYCTEIGEESVIETG